MIELAEPVAAEADRVVYRPELQTLLGGVSSETIRRWLLAKKLPEPDVQMSLRTVGWRLSTLRAHGVKVG